MPIVKKTDVLPERPVIIVLYGVPGSGKTSVATTAEKPFVD
ncbi:Zeta toxin [gut metagenome]|uniref:Zeta toxin n=1 Tax=gut metagenome TaxID=749906 RepID=J9F574_9ZZZZ